MEWGLGLASGTSIFCVHLGDQAWWMEHIWVCFEADPLLGLKGLRLATHSAIICEALWQWA